LSWDKSRINPTVDAIIVSLEERNGDIRDLASLILIFENAYDDPTRGMGLEQIGKYYSKEEVILEKSYNAILKNK